MIRKTRTIGWIKSDYSSEMPIVRFELVFQIVEETLVMRGDEDLAAAKHRGDEAGDRAPMIGIVGSNDVIERQDRRRAIELFDGRHTQRQRHRMNLGIAQVAAWLNASPILCEINHKIEALLISVILRRQFQTNRHRLGPLDQLVDLVHRRLPLVEQHLDLHGSRPRSLLPDRSGPRIASPTQPVY